MPLTGDFNEFRFVDIMPFFEANTVSLTSEWLPGEGEMVMFIHRGELLHVQVNGKPHNEHQAREDIRLLFARGIGRFTVRRVPFGAIPRSMRVSIGAVVLKTSAEFDEFRSGAKTRTVGRPMPEREAIEEDDEDDFEPAHVPGGFWGQVRALFGFRSSSRAG